MTLASLAVAGSVETSMAPGLTTPDVSVDPVFGLLGLADFIQHVRDRLLHDHAPQCPW
jgi:hypothetical protein